VALPGGARALPTDDEEIDWWRRGGRKKKIEINDSIITLNCNYYKYFKYFPLRKVPSSHTTFSKKKYKGLTFRSYACDPTMFHNRTNQIAQLALYYWTEN
jgi:hypothetical protein